MQEMLGLDHKESDMTEHTAMHPPWFHILPPPLDIPDPWQPPILFSISVILFYLNNFLEISFLKVLFIFRYSGSLLLHGFFSRGDEAGAALELHRLLPATVSLAVQQGFWGAPSQ